MQAQASDPKQIVQRGIDTFDPSTTTTIPLGTPLPATSTEAMWLRKMVDNKAQRRKFQHRENVVDDDVVSGVKRLVSIELRGASELSVKDLKLHVAYALQRYDLRLEEMGVGVDIIQEEIPTGEGGRTIKQINRICMTCPFYKGNWARGGCISASWTWGGAERNSEYVLRYRYHRWPEENRAMELGTDAHDRLMFGRNPVIDVNEFLERLVKGERVTWVISICSMNYGLRARPPDAVVSQLKKTSDGYQLDHWIIEDKKSGNPGYWPQVYTEAMILTDKKALLHQEFSRKDFQKTPGIPLLEALREKLKLPDVELVHVNVYAMINVYGDSENPADNYSWILSDEKRPNGLDPKIKDPILFSRDHVIEQEYWGRANGVIGIRNSRHEAFLDGKVERQEVVVRQMHFTSASTEHRKVPKGHRKGRKFKPIDEETSIYLPPSEF